MGLPSLYRVNRHMRGKAMMMSSPFSRGSEKYIHPNISSGPALVQLTEEEAISREKKYN